MQDFHFKDNFWDSDLTSTRGYETIVQHLSDGKKICTEVEDFLKSRASVEERYAKDLLGLSKKVCGHNEMNTLKRSLDMLKLQTEHMSLSHLQLAQTMREEAQKLEDFRERQKDVRKKAEQLMDVFQKQKTTQFKKTMESKKAYEQKCRDKEKADQNVNRNARANNTKHAEKLCSKAQQAKENAEEADSIYQRNVSTLGKIRDEWLKEHVEACETFEMQAAERISILRNAVWTHVNQLSQQCVTSDELYEEVRKSLEQCDIQEDIGYFVNLRRTGDKPPAPVLYENFYTGQRTQNIIPHPPRQPPLISRRGPLPDPVNNDTGDVIYSTVSHPQNNVIHF